ncbi:MAG: acetyltransferase [Alphaproteobacteria bacterium]|nr:acetyltransferase [Alphaproteobacteria bacterium]
MTTQKPVVLIGAGGHAKVVLDLCEKTSLPVRGVIDASLPPDASFYGVPVLGNDSLLGDKALKAVCRFVIAIGDGRVRREIARRLASSGAELITLIHPSAIVGARSTFGPGTVVFAGAVINCDSVIGGHAIINTGARVDHDCRIGEGVHLCPGVVLAGTVAVGDWTMIGAGSVVSNNRAVGAHAMIGAGSVVVEDVPERSLAYGNPCSVRRLTGG